MKKLALIAALALIPAMPGCQKSPQPDALHAGDAMPQNTSVQSPFVDIVHETKFGGVYTRLPIPTFHTYGFEYGDSVDVEFDNGYTMTDLPYYNGYFVKAGMPMISGYPGEKYIYFGYNDGEDAWDLANATENTKVRFTLRERAKYKSVQDSFQLAYTDARSDYPSDPDYGNFRALSGGKLKQNILYRSASPIDDTRSRAKTVDTLARETGIQFIIDLADSAQEVQNFIDSDPSRSPYFQQLMHENRVAMLDLSSNYRKQLFKSRLAGALTSMLEYDGPYLIHCLEGKDRTGFASIVIESLCGASYEEMKNDYMKTYDIYYHINSNNRSNSYHAIIDLLFNAMVGLLAGTEDISTLKSLDYTNFAEQYLKDGGMTDEIIQRLKAKICID